ncbi:CubicO group peptidase (beta-lactamase class C family) [Kribbella sp. VKM Ac-2571]|uniref:serine hydrolase domain-containing protein n=1 Tax=Kribbella sp. VKM Ac-2571 TaxID=2512222 RepID=UPI0010EDE19B|nr:serine hydrolase domain-containing protein [Kribbella sp. VKM Ac-2571]TDO67636.1 CubicO group peptidase (beta-lactamase class C family) [Kribbella sp. VKM Ac-2571]
MTQTVTEALAYYDSWLAFNQRYQRVPGVQVAVYVEDAIAFSTSYGMADVENDVPLTDQHLFRIASHSKTFTGTAIFQLVEQDRLRLDDKVSQHVTEIVGTPAGERTVRELLAHAGGLTRDSLDANWWQLSTAFPDRDQLLDVLRDESSAVIAENERFKYSNIGYGLLGLVVEAASGTPYNSYVQTAIVDKLGLSGLGPELDPARLNEYAAGYSALTYADTRVPIEHVDTRALASATGFFGNARDLVTYFSAHLPGDNRLLSDKSKREMQHPLWTTGADEKARYGLGMAVNKVGDREVFGHGGGYPGHITRTLVDPEHRIVVSVLTNAIDGPASQLAEGLFRLLDLAESKDRGEGDLDRFTGRFANLWGVTDFVVIGGRLYATDPSGLNPADEPQPLEADGDTLRVTGGNGYGSYGESYRFTFDADGAVKTVHGSSGLSLEPIETFTLPERVTVAQ